MQSFASITYIIKTPNYFNFIGVDICRMDAAIEITLRV